MLNVLSIYEYAVFIKKYNLEIKIKSKCFFNYIVLM